MKLNIVDKGHSNVMNGADIPDGTVFTAAAFGKIGLYVKYCCAFSGVKPSITVISAEGLDSGTIYNNPDLTTFQDYKVVEELTAVVKQKEF